MASVPEIHGDVLPAFLPGLFWRRASCQQSAGHLWIVFGLGARHSLASLDDLALPNTIFIVCAAPLSHERAANIGAITSIKRDISGNWGDLCSCADALRIPRPSGGSHVRVDISNHVHGGHTPQFGAFTSCRLQHTDLAGIGFFNLITFGLGLSLMANSFVRVHSICSSTPYSGCRQWIRTRHNHAAAFPDR